MVFELIPIKNLMSNQVYQRPLSEGHIISAVKDFDVYQINPVKVSRRNGINYVFDGQHTIEIVASRSGSRDTPVWCMVYDQLQYQEEAHIFAEQQRHVKALVPYCGESCISNECNSIRLAVPRLVFPSIRCGFTSWGRFVSLGMATASARVRRSGVSGI